MISDDEFFRAFAASAFAIMDAELRELRSSQDAGVCGMRDTAKTELMKQMVAEYRKRLGLGGVPHTEIRYPAYREA